MTRILNRKALYRKRNRKGASVVEAALMLPLLMVLTFGSIDLAQYINSGQVITNASREGARVASRSDTVQEVQDRILEYLGGTMPQLSDDELADAVTIQVREVTLTTTQSDEEGGEEGGEVTTKTYTAIPNDDLTTITSGNSISVIVEFEYSRIRWLQGPTFSDQEIETVCRRE